MKKFLYIFFLTLTLNCYAKIGDPNPVLYKNIIYTSHNNFVYAYNVSKLNNSQIEAILNKKIFIDNSDNFKDNDLFINIIPIWSTKVFQSFLPLFLGADRFNNIITELRIEGEYLIVKNSRDKIFRLNLITGKKIKRLDS